MMTPILLFTFLFSAIHALDPNCPLPENIAPKCICKDLGDGPMLLCHNVMNPDELIVPITASENRNVFSLSIYNSSLFYIPDGIFKNTHFKKIHLVGTMLMSLAETDLAFEGLENTLVEFRVTDAHYGIQWSWSQLRNLRKLQLIVVDWISLGSFGEPFPPLKSLTTLAITKADISFIVDYAFKDLENLRMLVLMNNDISELNRNMFPDPADKLMFLDLSNNKLKSLPSDIFQRMPNLNDLKLANNEFTTMKEEVFSPVVSSIQVLDLSGNELRCDCRMRWIVEVKKPMELDAVCSQPENLKGFGVKYLSLKELACF